MNSKCTFSLTTILFVSYTWSRFWLLQDDIFASVLATGFGAFSGDKYLDLIVVDTKLMGMMHRGYRHICFVHCRAMIPAFVLYLNIMFFFFFFLLALVLCVRSTKISEFSLLSLL